MKQYEFLGVKIHYNNKVISIKNSHNVHSTAIMELILMKFIQDTKYKTKRTMSSWLREWKAHNRLYKLGLYRKHTVDCDLEENEKKRRLVAYCFLGI